MSMMETMLRNPEMQKMMYPHLPEHMRNPSSIEWMLNDPAMKKQMAQMFESQASPLFTHTFVVFARTIWQEDRRMFAGPPPHPLPTCSQNAMSPQMKEMMQGMNFDQVRLEEGGGL